MSTAAATLIRVQALSTGFASVTQAQIDAIWPEVVARSGSARWGDNLGAAYALLSAHLLALDPAGSAGSGVGLLTGSSSSSGLSISRHLPAADARNIDLDQTVWGQRWRSFAASIAEIDAPRIYM